MGESMKTSHTKNIQQITLLRWHKHHNHVEYHHRKANPKVLQVCMKMTLYERTAAPCGQSQCDDVKYFKLEFKTLE